MDELDSMVAMMVADIVSNEESSPPRAEAPADYNTNNSWISATRDMSACQILSPTTSLLKSVAKASSSSSQKVGEDASRRKELRLIKNRQAAKESRRRKKEYIKYLEACASMLQLQNTKLREEINYMKGVSGDKKQ
ncbi:cAMP-responsive element modulator [Bagarius yarrelli]|uniref:cAMP-responsive element modulator n=1 Tax=Bagarius yarrelli TaxID=175774 RepID=A0A556TQB7_BAGYA|nr:cAMP-responsive element modulator [Bagarius yarrelli]